MHTADAAPAADGAAPADGSAAAPGSGYGREAVLPGSRRLPERPGFTSPYPVSVAPMMDRTDKFFRWFLRQITPNTLLYSEMVSTGAIVHGDRERHLGFFPEEKPLALQLGGSDPAEVGEAVRIAEDWDYDEVNLNVGCPSDRVQHRGIGACLMADPPRVAQLVEVMRANTRKPVTVKHRIGIDGRESFEELCEFVDVVARAGVERLTVHARIAILEGLSPKDNRNVPPLRYEDVYRLKCEFPELEIEINGHIGSVADIRGHLQQVDAVMLGRAAYDNPYLFADIEREIFGGAAGAAAAGAAGGAMDAAGASGAGAGAGAVWQAPSRAEVIARTIEFLETRWRDDFPRAPLGHLMGLYHGMPGARRWRGTISTELAAGTAPAEVLRRAQEVLPKI
ncbi:tRNA dihydrouridine(20/20a) synthase DusA [Spirochaeta africana]|uniref:tRNA-dihydrouridine(20/20a) synthase n=1 Tax=Spirochaeta africana (strain ATCC 700263 / DSM 8902 / Z-7692) TaxID=889378 RepID=H9UGA5_SPIAZ|nr:tRNA dihydrouridine(20/20a) synthase DusA [Spirochaeta africana]AFG36548.1 tRNA-dihydrouridine synthase [Spirochaeta africana DSM 8902]